jgi:dTMP kinase
MKKGKLIVIEGTDGSGKKTQLELLVKKLKQEKIKHKLFDFPQYNKFFGKMVANYLNGGYGGLNDVSPYLISMLYAFDRMQAKDDMEKALKQGFIVLCNRYSISNQAHQTAKLPEDKREDFLDWLRDLEYNQLKIPKEDLVIFLDVPDKLANRLMEKRKSRLYTKKKLDLHEANKSYLQKTRKIYRALAKQKNWARIDCTRNNKLLSKENISGLLWKEIIRII